MLRILYVSNTTEGEQDSGVGYPGLAIRRDPAVCQWTSYLGSCRAERSGIPVDALLARQVIPFLLDFSSHPKAQFIHSCRYLAHDAAPEGCKLIQEGSASIPLVVGNKVTSDISARLPGRERQVDVFYPPILIMLSNP